MIVFYTIPPPCKLNNVCRVDTVFVLSVHKVTLLGLAACQKPCSLIFLVIFAVNN